MVSIQIPTVSNNWPFGIKMFTIKWLWRSSEYWAKLFAIQITFKNWIIWPTTIAQLITSHVQYSDDLKSELFVWYSNRCLFEIWDFFSLIVLFLATTPVTSQRTSPRARPSVPSARWPWATWRTSLSLKNPATKVENLICITLMQRPQIQMMSLSLT